MDKEQREQEADQIAKATEGMVWYKRIPEIWRLVRSKVYRPRNDKNARLQ